MSKLINLPENLVHDLFWEHDPGEVVERDGKSYTVVENQLDWQDDGKYSSSEIIFQVDGKYYAAYPTRSGSYFTDYEYDWPTEAYEVHPVEITKVEWKTV